MSVLPDGDGVFRERRTREVDASAEVLWSCVADLGSAPGWYAANRLWAFRHLVDGLVGGPGRRGRPDRPLRRGDPVDGWRVHDVQEGRSLTRRSEHRMPGHALLTYDVLTPVDGAGALLRQRLEWHPPGVGGETDVVARAAGARARDVGDGAQPRAGSVMPSVTSSVRSGRRRSLV